MNFSSPSFASFSCQYSSLYPSSSKSFYFILGSTTSISFFISLNLIFRFVMCFSLPSSCLTKQIFFFATLLYFFYIFIDTFVFIKLFTFFIFFFNENFTNFHQHFITDDMPFCQTIVHETLNML